MRTPNVDDDRLRKALADAYLHAPAPAGGAAWEAGVMRTVRAAAQAEAKETAEAFFDRVFWRFAATAAIAIIALGALLLAQNAASDAALADLATAAPYSTAMLDVFGL